ncbi:low density lipoprotein receptor adapter protein 1-like isoform X2 [Leguminivora glycinivorella]|uniref:low density lipoprotein receptor adapter protein 1-like isoform X1 n=1 Tax=Leguminivora glycinivorella TaxID=1035111 RepID=UPI00200EB8CB|nr:low density lipoprotein receptor adapter protein 1-like isoform X1 [Leguminivora glycinivorella]XP_047992935.1 low density lipoprotein receptor adapter protein 1-like isoform X2 [Leguminivora glycinivorella]
MTTFIRKMWKNRSKHKKLEEWALAECEGESWWREARESTGKEASVDVRYAGMVPVERAASAPATAIAVRSALHSAKTLNKKLQRVSLDISAKGIVVTDADTHDNVLSISIYRISYCSADAANARVFAVVEGRGCEHVAHVFTCPRSRHARALALALAHAFNDAYQAWQNNHQGSSLQRSDKRSSPWERFHSESDEEELEDEQWQAQAPLVTFA